MDSRVIDHFKKIDGVLFSALETTGQIDHLVEASEDEYFANLCRSIINQQISNKAGAAILLRFKTLFPQGKITPEIYLELKEERVREIGLSRTKVIYIRDLAEKIIKREVAIYKLKDLSNEEVISELIKVKGIGVWTAEMFLMNSLAREDIFSYGDLGLRNAIKRLYGLGDFNRGEAAKIVEKWSPYKTYASKILWKSLFPIQMILGK